VPGKHGRIATERRERLQAAEHVVDAAAGEVGAAAAFQKQRVARDESAVEQEALAARRVAGGVQQLDVDGTDLDHIAVHVRGELAARQACDA